MCGATSFFASLVLCRNTQETIIDIIQFRNSCAILLFLLIFLFCPPAILYGFAAHSARQSQTRKRQRINFIARCWRCVKMEHRQKGKKKQKEQERIHFGGAIKYHHRYRLKAKMTCHCDGSQVLIGISPQTLR